MSLGNRNVKIIGYGVDNVALASYVSRNAKEHCRVEMIWIT